MRVGVDREPATGFQRLAQQPLRRVEAFRAAVDLDRLVVFDRGGEHRLGVERALRPAAPHHEPARAVAEDVHVRVGERGQHALGHDR